MVDILFVITGIVQLWNAIISFNGSALCSLNCTTCQKCLLPHLISVKCSHDKRVGAEIWPNSCGELEYFAESISSIKSWVGEGPY